MNDIATPESVDELNKSILEAVNDDLKLSQFLLEWLRNGMNGTQAYLTTHPGVNPRSASELASLTLAKINFLPLLAYYGLNQVVYLEQLRGGLRALKWNNDRKQYEPDHRTRRMYHQTLGKILKIEGIDDRNSMPHIKFIAPDWFSEEAIDYSEQDYREEKVQDSTQIANSSEQTKLS